MRSVYIICPVRIATDDVVARLEAYTHMLEDNGVDVHLPHRDTAQDARGLDICCENAMAIYMADEIHIFYNPKSQGIHFDLGVAFTLDQIAGKKKTIKLISISHAGNISVSDGFEAMIDQWILDKVNHGEQEMEFEYQCEE